ncbi:MAG: hypothetical protein VX044_01450 [Planctomycetota bacterium]|nr:hypothetical protein [Planctomycetota bacterium]
MLAFTRPSERRFGPLSEQPQWRGTLLVAAATGAVAATRPWVEVKFHRLFGEELGPPAWQSTAGFTCLCTCALIGVMALAETHSRASRQATRPASALLASVMALVLLLRAVDGPGMLRGVSGEWTPSSFVAAGASALMLAVCLARARR